MRWQHDHFAQPSTVAHENALMNDPALRNEKDIVRSAHPARIKVVFLKFNLRQQAGRGPTTDLLRHGGRRFIALSPDPTPSGEAVQCQSPLRQQKWIIQ